MATGNSFTIRVYGTVDGAPSYVTEAGGNLPSVQATFSSDATLDTNFPAASNIQVWPIGGYGAVMNGNTSCYGVIEVPPSGLNQQPDRFVVQQTVAQVATLRNV